jgi:hypothetical protein
LLLLVLFLLLLLLGQARAPEGDDQRAEAVVGRENAPVDEVVLAGPGDQGGELGQEFQRGVVDVGGAVVPGLLEGKAYVAVGQKLQAVLGERGAETSSPISPVIADPRGVVSILCACSLRSSRQRSGTFLIPLRIHVNTFLRLDAAAR